MLPRRSNQAASCLPRLIGLAILVALGACGPGEEPTPAVADDPAPGEVAVLEGSFHGIATGDYNHVLVGRHMGPDCDFWGFGPTAGNTADRLEQDPDLFGQRVVVAFEERRTFIPEAGEELDLPLTEAALFPEVPGLDAGLEPMSASRLLDLETLAAVRAAASDYTREVSGVELELRIVDVGVKGEEAFAVALFEDHPDPTWQRGFVRLAKEEGIWVGRNYGSGLEPPSWYLCGTDEPPPLGQLTDEEWPSLDGWSGVYLYEESGFAHGGVTGRGITSDWLWILRVEPGAEGRLTINGFQTAEAYDVRLEGDAQEVRVINAKTLDDQGGRSIETGEVLLTLHRSGYQLLTRLDARSPSLESAEGERWAVRFRRQ